MTIKRFFRNITYMIRDYCAPDAGSFYWITHIKYRYMGTCKIHNKWCATFSYLSGKEAVLKIPVIKFRLMVLRGEAKEVKNVS
jgi:hypothetical protein